MQSSHDQSAHLQSIREEYIEQISLYGKARCRFEIRLMAGEVRKMDVRHLLGRKENSDDNGGSKPDAEQDDAFLLAKASDVPLGIREHRQSLITDEHLPASPKTPLAQPERRLSVPLELLTKEWPQLTNQQEAQPWGTASNNLTTTRTATFLSRPELVHVPTTATRYGSFDISANDSLGDDNDQPSSLLPLHEISSSAHTAPIDDRRPNSYDFFSPSIIPLPPRPRLPDFEYGDLIRQVRVAPSHNNRLNKKQKHCAGEIIQPIADPFSAPRLHRVVRLTPREHDRLQKRLSRQWLFWLLLVGSVPCPWLLLLFGFGMMDEVVEWLTEGDVVEFGPWEKKVGVWVGFVVTGLWIGVGVGVGLHNRNA